MRLFQQEWTGILIIVVMSLVTGHGAAASCTLTVGWEPYVPYQFTGEKGEVTGADIELMRTIAKEIGCQTVFKELPWARQLSELKNGTLDVAMSASKTPEREAYVRFSIPYRQSEMAIFVRDGTASQHPLSSLSEIPRADFRLGVIFGYYYGDEFETLKDDPTFASHVDAAADYPTNIRKLLHERIDGLLVDDLAVMRAAVRELGVVDQVERHPLHIPGDEFHIMFSRQSVDPELVANVDRTLEKMESDGSIEAIFEEFVQW